MSETLSYYTRRAFAELKLAQAAREPAIAKAHFRLCSFFIAQARGCLPELQQMLRIGERASACETADSHRSGIAFR